MRSLHHSSAGVFNTLPLNLTPLNSQPPPVVTVDLGHQQPNPTSHNDLPNPLNNQHSFFNIRNNTLPFSAQTRNHVSRAIQGGWAESTLRRYSGSIKQYIRFCDAERVPEHLRFPADEFVLCAFAASSFGRHAGGTPRSRISALKAWHVAHNEEWKGSARLRYVLNGVHNFAPRSSRRAPRPPVNAQMLTLLVQNLNTNSPLDAAVAACAATAFWGQCRLGELLPSSSSSPSPTLPTRADFKRSVKNSQLYVLRLPRTKTHRHGQEVVLVDQQLPINPIFLLKNHFRVSRTPLAHSLLSFKTADGFSVLTKSVFLRRCNSVWSSLGYPRTTGHSFRIGGTTELLIAGTPPDIVRATGRWSSASFFRYWRSLDDIAPFHIRNIHSRKRRRSRR